MSRNAWIYSGHSTPLATDLVEVRVADTAKKDFNLNVGSPALCLVDDGGGKAAILHHQKHKPWFYTDHVIQR